MTTLYRPVLIESAEQAEALPARTPVLMGPFVAHRPRGNQGWAVTDAGGEYSSEELIAAHSHLNPTALVPIEAEEETLERQRFSQAGPDVLHRFTTPWTLYTAKETP